MCYSPTKDSVRLIAAAEECIKDGNLSGAQRLLDSAKQIMTPVVHKVGQRYVQVQLNLRSAKRNEP
jgi:hypothetical protein